MVDQPVNQFERGSETVKPIVKKDRLYKKIIQSIMSFIEENNMKPGERLPSERALAELLDVSRTTVKEAVSVLEANGIVHIRQGVGIFLAASNSEQFQKEISEILVNQKGRFQEMIELRQAIEGDAAYYAAERITPMQKEKLTKAYEELILAESAGRTTITEDLNFHLSISEASNNNLLFEVMKLISSRMEVFLIQNRAKMVEGTEQIKNVTNEHSQIYDSIINGEPDLAKQAMWDHLHSIKIRHEHEWSE